MSGYVKAHEFDVKFDGDTVVVRARPLEQGDLLRMRALVGGDDANEFTTMESMSGIVKKYVESVAGLYDAGQNPVTVEEVTTAAYFTNLVVSIAGELFKRALPTNP